MQSSIYIYILEQDINFESIGCMGVLAAVTKRSDLIIYGSSEKGQMVGHTYDVYINNDIPDDSFPYHEVEVEFNGFARFYGPQGEVTVGENSIGPKLNFDNSLLGQEFQRSIDMSQLNILPRFRPDDGIVQIAFNDRGESICRFSDPDFKSYVDVLLEKLPAAALLKLKNLYRIIFSMHESVPIKPYLTVSAESTKSAFVDKVLRCAELFDRLDK